MAWQQTSLPSDTEMKQERGALGQQVSVGRGGGRWFQWQTEVQVQSPQVPWLCFILCDGESLESLM